MNKFFLLLLVSLGCCCQLSQAQVLQYHAPTIQWECNHGGTDDDFCYGGIKTLDSGYIAIGSSFSKDWDITDTSSGKFFWVVKLDASGNMVSQKSLGGYDHVDNGRVILQTSDSGIVYGGFASSFYGDLLGSGRKDTLNSGNYDYWLIKFDKQGNKVWSKCYGGTDREEPSTMLLDKAGNILVLGETDSHDSDAISSHVYNANSNAGADMFLVKISSVTGQKIWSKCYGGLANDFGESIKATKDGGYIMAGSCSGHSGDVQCNYHWIYDYDAWIVKIDSNGNKQWQGCYGGHYDEWAHDITPTPDGGYVFVGYTLSNDGDVSGYRGGVDGWVVKIDSVGTLLWQKCIGGTRAEAIQSISQKADGRLLLEGWTNSDDSDVSGAKGSDDVWLVELSANGDLLWQKCIGGPYAEDPENHVPGSMITPNDSEIVLFVNSTGAGGDVGGGFGNWDYWIVKLKETKPDTLYSGMQELNSDNKLIIYPNPATNQLTVISHQFSVKTIEVRNVLGQLVICPSLLANSTDNCQLNTANLPSGIYFLKVTDEKGFQHSAKFVKE